MTDASLAASRFTEGDFRIGQVLARAWSVFSRNFLTFMLVTGIASLPSLLIRYNLGGSSINLVQNQGLVALGWFLAILLGTLSQAIVLYAAFEVMRGRPVNLAESAKVGLRRFFPVVGLAIVVSLLIGFGLVLLIVPGAMLYTMWFVATPACVVERLGVLGSMGRSRELTKGHRWKILGLYLLVLIPALIIGGIVGGITAAGGAAALSAALASTLGQVVNLVWSAAWTAFLAVAVVVTYHDLRVAKEGVDTEQIAAVFE
jgi:hypothetical protein